MIGIGNENWPQYIEGSNYFQNDKEKYLKFQLIASSIFDPNGEKILII